MATKTSILPCGSAKSDARDAPKAVQDPDLDKIIEIWPELADHIGAAIKALVQADDKRVG